MRLARDRSKYESCNAKTDHGHRTWWVTQSDGTDFIAGSGKGLLITLGKRINPLRLDLRHTSLSPNADRHKRQRLDITCPSIANSNYRCAQSKQAGSYIFPVGRFTH